MNENENENENESAPFVHPGGTTYGRADVASALVAAIESVGELPIDAVIQTPLDQTFRILKPDGSVKYLTMIFLEADEDDFNRTGEVPS